MSALNFGSVIYVLKRQGSFSETYIANEIRAMERLGSQIMMYSLSPPEPPHKAPGGNATGLRYYWPLSIALTLTVPHNLGNDKEQ